MSGGCLTLPTPPRLFLCEPKKKFNLMANALILINMQNINADKPAKTVTKTAPGHPF